MTGHQWTVYWTEYTSRSYTYGSEIRFLPEHAVGFSNALMPPGTVINEWLSRTNFQADRLEPSLPLMDGEAAYRIHVNMDFDGEHSERIMLRILFYNRYDEKVSSEILRGPENYFKPPIQTYSYRIELINGGIREFTFRSLVITEVGQEEYDAEQERIKKTKQAAKKGKMFRRKHKKADQ